MSLIAEVPEFIQIFSDGTVKRFNLQTTPPSSDSSNNYQSKDIIIDPSKPITARIFIPNHIPNKKLLPLLVYFHGGGFCIGSTTWLGYNKFLGELSFTSQSIVLSVDYRLAPEHRLPIAYEDCYASLEWVSENVKIEPLLQFVDLSNVFLSGDSAGANISHYVAVKAIKNDGFCPVKVKGVMLIHPYFGSEKRTEKEMEEESVEHVRISDLFWGLSLPEGSNRDYFGCNFENDDVSESVWLRFPAVEVYVAGKDFLKERGVMYGEFVSKKGVKAVNVVEAKDEKHVFHVFFPESDATRLLQSQMSQFMKRCLDLD